MSEQRLIDAEALKQDMCDKAMSIYDIDQIINNAPTIEARPVVRGKWNCHGDCGVTQCDACEWSIEEYVGDYKFCPNCGAQMQEE